MNAIVGDWGKVFDTTIIGIHQVMLEDGRVLYWGGDGNGAAFSNTQKYGIFDPATGDHEILEAGHAVRMFCGAGVILPGTDKVLIAGGNGSGAPGGQIFDTSDKTLVRDSANDMDTGRFYPTMVSLSSGQAVILGGNGDANKRAIPEIFTLGEGWRSLDGAKDADLGGSWWYPRAWVNGDGEVVYFSINAGNQNANLSAPGSLEVMALDPSGDGSIRQIGEVPFQMDVTAPSAMYDVGKIVIMDGKGDLWIMDINGDTPQFEQVADLPFNRDNSDMTVMPDGRVLINGGTTKGNSQNEADAIFESVIFDPYSGEVKTVDAEDVMRVYHSSSILLNDGTIMSMGGGGLGGTKNFMDAQIYTPDYLYNADGSLADRPEVLSAPDSLEPGDTFVITVDDTASLDRISFVKTGAVTHSLNMESGRMDLDFKVVDGQRVEVTLPDNPNVVGAGNWMLFAIDDQGVPSVAPIISVEPTLPTYKEPGAIDPVDGMITVEYFNADVSKLDDINFDGTPIFTEEVTEIQEKAGTGAFYNGGPTDKFAALYSGDFAVEKAGQYTFYLTSDDGSNLSIDGKQLISNDGLHADVEKSATIFLDAGVHSLEAKYFEQGGAATMQLDWKGPDFKRVDFEVNGEDPQEPGNIVNDIANQTQYLTGTSDNDVFAINGQSSDYGWGETEDGSGIVVWGPTGHDLLFDFEAIKFNDTTVPLVAEDGRYDDIAGTTQFLTGTPDKEESFVIDGRSADYNWGATDDGEGIVVWGPTGTDLLYDFDKIVFSDKEVELGNQTGPDGGLIVKDDPARTQYETGTDKTDTFVIEGNSANYGWGKTDDNEGVVVWNTSTDAHDLLYDFEAIQFNDQTLDLDAEFA